MSEIYTDPPQSRNEAIIKSTIDGTQYTDPPQSRMEDLLLELKEAIEQGGGGTTNYNQLTNKPSINDVTLSGNKTASDLGLMPTYEVDTTPAESSENLITSGGVWNADKNINNKLQGSKTAGSTDGSPFEIPDYGMTESIQMYFKPTQDLHGYNKPWAGGAGKNKFIYPYPTSSSSFGGVTWTITPYEIHLAGTSTSGFTIVLAGKSGTTWGNVGNAISLVDTDGSYTFSGGTSKIPLVVFQYRNGVRAQEYRMTSATTIEIEASDLFEIGLGIQTGIAYDDSTSPQIELGQTATDFEPYSNICPISGQDNATFEWTDSHDIENEVTMNFGNTYYGGFCQFNGQVYSQWSYIASYNGEILSGEWVSDRDEYVAGTTPTIGAEVAYYDSQSTDYFRVTPPANLNLTDDYPIEYNGYMANISYQPKNTVLKQAKQYTNQKISALGFPNPPTTDGTYHLECSVSGGIPTIRWVSNS